MSHAPFPSGQEDTWGVGDKLRIPPLPPSELIYCSIIDTRYVLKVHIIIINHNHTLILCMQIINLSGNGRE